MADSDGVKKELKIKKRDDMTEDIKDSVKESSNLSEGSATETEDVAKTPLRQSRCKDVRSAMKFLSVLNSTCEFTWTKTHIIARFAIASSWN